MKKNIFKYKPSTYTPILKTARNPLSEKEMRAEYSRLRAIASKRLKRLGAQVGTTDSYYNYYKDMFPKLSELKSKKSVAVKLMVVHDFLVSDMSSLTGRKRIQRKTLSTLKERGYGFVNAGNISEFGEFMEYARELLDEYLYDSEEIAEFFELAESSESDIKEAFNLWAHSKNKPPLPPTRNASSYKKWKRIWKR